MGLNNKVSISETLKVGDQFWTFLFFKKVLELWEEDFAIRKNWKNQILPWWTPLLWIEKLM